jgi:hypothetical protein
MMSIIHKSEYLRWRLHGLANEIREASQSSPNRTLATADAMKQVLICLPLIMHHISKNIRF